MGNESTHLVAVHFILPILPLFQCLKKKSSSSVSAGVERNLLLFFFFLEAQFKEVACAKNWPCKPEMRAFLFLVNCLKIKTKAWLNIKNQLLWYIFNHCSVFFVSDQYSGVSVVFILQLYTPGLSLLIIGVGKRGKQGLCVLWLKQIPLLAKWRSPDSLLMKWTTLYLLGGLVCFPSCGDNEILMSDNCELGLLLILETLRFFQVSWTLTQLLEYCSLFIRFFPQLWNFQRRLLPDPRSWCVKDVKKKKANPPPPPIKNNPPNKNIPQTKQKPNTVL